MKVAIYTALYGDKDVLRPPLGYSKADAIPYFVFSDKKMDVEPYQSIIRPAKFTDVAKNARYYKILGNPVLNDYDLLIWHDANIQLCHTEIQNLVTLASQTFLTTFKHPNRDDFYSEAMSSIRVDKDFSLRILRQALYYFVNGMPAHAGMYATGILIKNQNIDSGDFYTMWWEQTLKYSRRDQLSIVYTSYKTKQKINVIEADIFNNNFSKYHLHKYQHYIEHNQVMKYNYGFLKKLSSLTVKFLRKIKKLVQ